MKSTRIAAFLFLSVALASRPMAARPAAAPPLIADFVAHGEAFVPNGPMLLSRCSGPATSKYYVEWPRHELCVHTATFDALGNITRTDAGVKPSGMQADPLRVKELCQPDELCDDPMLSAVARKGLVHSVQFFIQDDIGFEAVQHESERITLDVPAQTSPCGFVVHVHRDFVPIWRLAGHTGGPRVAIVGTVSVGDIWYRPATPCK